MPEAICAPIGASFWGNTNITNRTATPFLFTGTDWQPELRSGLNGRLWVALRPIPTTIRMS
jgi:hypothetical protein